MSKGKKHEEAINAIIEIVINKGERTECTEKEMEQVRGIAEQIEKEKDRVMELQKNMKFFKTTLVSAEALKKVIELSIEEKRKIDLISMAEILIGILVVFEEKGFVKIIEEDQDI